MSISQANRFAHIRRYYGVPAKRGGRVKIWTGEIGTIIWANMGNLRIRLDGQRYAGYYHPVFGIEYLSLQQESSATAA